VRGSIGSSTAGGNETRMSIWVKIAILATTTIASLIIASDPPAGAAFFAKKSAEPTSSPTLRPEPCPVIPVELTDQLDTGRAHTGDVFHFRTIDTIVLPDHVTIRLNATGHGLIAFAEAAGAHGKSGDLIIEARYIDVPGHGQYQVTIDSVATSAVLNGKSGNAASGLSIVPLPFVGTAVGAFNYIHAGKNAVVNPGTRFSVVPVGDLKTRKLCAL
jgi:hypothetical protein